MSRRRRGLPPDTSPALLNRIPLDNRLSKKCRTLQNTGDVPVETHRHIVDTQQKEACCDKDVKEEHRSLEDKTTVSHDESSGWVGDMVADDLQNSEKVEQLGLVSALEPHKEGVTLTNATTDYDLSRVTEVMGRQVREKRPKTVTRTVSRGATAKTTLTKEKVNSATTKHAYTHLPASSSAKHTVKDTNKDSSKDKCISSTSNLSMYNAHGAGEDSSKGTINDLAKDSAPVSSCSSTSKITTKGPTQTKSTTSAIKTRTSPRILLKR